MRWDHSRALEVGRDVVATEHRLCELQLANRQRLIQTLDRHPWDAMSMYTMGANPPHQSQSGELANCNGGQLLDTIESGQLVLVLHDVALHHEDYCRITRQLYSELTECHIGLRIHDTAADLVLASSKTIQHYRCDHRPTIRWQLLGQQTVLTYPETPEFIDQRIAEDLIVDRSDRSLSFQSEFDEQATTNDVLAGQMLSLPHPMPYRVELGGESNSESDLGGGLNVWLQTQHDTRASFRRRNIYVANRVLRNLLPESFCGPELAGTWPAIKNFCARLCGLAERYGNHSHSSNEPAIAPKFDSNLKNFPTPITGLDIEAQNTTAVVLEN